MLRRLLTRVTTINVPLVAAALFASAILHILATLATPHLTPTSGYDLLARDLPLNSMQVLPAVTPDTQPVPFMTPDARYAVCRFDTEDGAVTLTAVLPEPGWVLSLYSPSGDAFFTSVASPARRSDVSVLLVPGSDDWRAGTAAPAVAVTGESMLTIPANRGLAVLRAPDQGEAYQARSLAELKRARCQFRKARAS